MHDVAKSSLKKDMNEVEFKKNDFKLIESCEKTGGKNKFWRQWRQIITLTESRLYFKINNKKYANSIATLMMGKTNE